MNEVDVRPARAGDGDTVIGLFDRAMLSFERSTVPDRVERGAVIVAVDDRRVIGAILLAGDHVEAIAVDRSHRGEGIGRALIEAVQERTNPVTVACHPQAAEFYRSLDFTLYALPGGRVFGYKRRDQTSGSTSS